MAEDVDIEASQRHCCLKIPLGHLQPVETLKRELEELVFSVQVLAAKGSLIASKLIYRCLGSDEEGAVETSLPSLFFFSFSLEKP
jgi:hypothetical protein